MSFFLECVCVSFPSLKYVTVYMAPMTLVLNTVFVTADLATILNTIFVFVTVDMSSVLSTVFVCQCGYGPMLNSLGVCHCTVFVTAPVLNSVFVTADMTPVLNTVFVFVTVHMALYSALSLSLQTWP